MRTFLGSVAHFEKNYSFYVDVEFIGEERFFFFKPEVAGCGSIGKNEIPVDWYNRAVPEQEVFEQAKTTFWLKCVLYWSEVLLGDLLYYQPQKYKKFIPTGENFARAGSFWPSRYLLLKHCIQKGESKHRHFMLKEDA